MTRAGPPLAAIAVPVRDEGPQLPRLLRALAAQRDAPSFSLHLFFDGCTDDSEGVVASLAASLPYTVASGGDDRTKAPNAGRARAAAAALALANAPAAMLLSTDADSEPAPDWVAASVAALRHADVVAGRVELDEPSRAPVQLRLSRYYDRLHARRRAIDPVAWEEDPTHHWTSAAAMAFRSDVYRALGGFAPLPGGEDADIADRAWRAGFRVRRDARVAVRTSTRRHGRAPNGFAAGLAALAETGDLPLVSHPGDELWRYRHHAATRRAFDLGQPCRLAGPLALDAAELRRIAAEVRNADAFAARVVGTPPGGMRQVTLDQAEALLGMASGACEDIA